eukprot:2280048-Rhodomonas_salina.2
MNKYNMWMGAIDDFTQLMLFHSLKLRSFKWWHSIFYFLIDVATINALHLWRIENPDVEARFTWHVWIAGLIEEILDKYCGKCGLVVTDLQPEAGPALKPGHLYCIGNSFGGVK